MSELAEMAEMGYDEDMIADLEDDMQETSMFWSLKIPVSGEIEIPEPPIANYMIHITKACFGPKVNNGSRTVVMCGTTQPGADDDDEDSQDVELKFAPICVLGANRAENVALDLLFNEAAQFKLQGNKPSEVWLTGHLQPGFDTDLDDMPHIMDPANREEFEMIDEDNKMMEGNDIEDEDEEDDDEDDDLVPSPPAQKKRKVSPTKATVTAKGTETLNGNRTNGNNDKDNNNNNNNNNNKNKNNKNKNKNKKSPKTKPVAAPSQSGENESNDNKKQGKKQQKQKQKQQKQNKQSPKQTAVATPSDKAKAQEKESVSQEPKQTEASKNKKKKKKNKKKGPGGIEYKDIREGNGRGIKKGDRVSVYYIGQLASDSSIFDKTLSGEGFSFTIGKNEVIKGWEMGLLGMKGVGSKRKLWIPPKLAYGKEAQEGIPANSTLLFTIELKKVQ